VSRDGLNDAGRRDLEEELAGSGHQKLTIGGMGRPVGGLNMRNSIPFRQ
jgi:hypothetical protein